MVVNLYPFEATVAVDDVTTADAIENIDIGGPAMIRAAAKNHAHVGVVTSPDQYDLVLAAVEQGGLDDELRSELAKPRSIAPLATTPQSSAGWNRMNFRPVSSCRWNDGGSSATGRTRTRPPPPTGRPEKKAGGPRSCSCRAKRCRSTTTWTPSRPGIWSSASRRPAASWSSI